MNRSFDASSELLVLRAASPDELIREAKGLAEVLSSAPGRPLGDICRSINSRSQMLPLCLAAVASSPEDLAAKLSWASKKLAEPQTEEIRGKQGVYFTRNPLGPRGKLAVLFPGEGSQYAYMLRDLCLAFPFVRACFDRIDRAFIERKLGEGFLPSRIVFPEGPGAPARASASGAGEDLWQMAGAVAAVLTANQALWELVGRLGIAPDGVVGHSTGEYTALQAAGILDLDSEDRYQEYIADLYRIYRESAEKGEIPRVKLVAVGADLEKVRAVLDSMGSGLSVAMDNCPHQVVVLGEDGEIERAVAEFSRLGMICQSLPFDRPYHSPLFAAYTRNLEPFFDKWLTRTPRIPIYSCAAADRFPEDLGEIRRLAVEHWVKPVRFRQTVERMYEEGFRIFVEAGPRGNLTAFVNDILREREHLAVASDVSSRSGIAQLQRLAALLCSHGVAVDLGVLSERTAAGAAGADFPQGAVAKSREPDQDGTAKLELELPRLRLGATPLPTRAGTGEAADPAARRAGPGSPNPVEPSLPKRQIAAQSGRISRTSPLEQETDSALEAYFRTMERFLEVQREVMVEYLGGEELSTGELFSADLWAALQPSTDRGSLPDHAPEGEAPAAPSRTKPQAGAAQVEKATLRMNAEADEKVSLAGRAGSRGLREELLSLVSEKTGYPVEMLDPSVNLEADLGIDSIKRIEILGSLWERHPELPRENLERAAALKTLAEVIAFVEHPDQEPQASGESQAVPAAPAVPDTEKVYPHAAPCCADFPLIDEILSWKPAESLRARRRFDPEHDRFLLDHTIGGKVSDAHPEWPALPVMPLTMSMEMMAEAAALLLPGRVLSAMKEVRAYRWISFERGAVTLEAVARLRPDRKEEVEVFLVEADGPSQTSGRPLVEGTMVFAGQYPETERPTPKEPPGGPSRPSRWQAHELYSGRMFHGPCWQAVRSIDRWSETGSISTFEVLPKERFFEPRRPGRFLTDPVVLDAAGQIVGFWTMEHLEEGFLVFPYRLRTLRIYGPPPADHDTVRCLAHIRLAGSHQVVSDIDLAAADGRLWMRLEGWEDKRFGIPASAYAFLLAPKKVVSSLRWDAPIASFPEADSFVCLRLDRLFREDSSFWLKVFSRLVLSPAEQEAFEAIGSSEERRIQWLLGRLVAKDAVRTYLRERRSLDVAPADVEIRQDEHGRPCPFGPWQKELDGGLCLSIAHTNGLCVAVAGPGNGSRSVGIDVEKVRPLREGFESAAFTASEQALLGSVGDPGRQEWMVRFWSAKEAAAKALGRGLAEGPQSLVVQTVDWAEGWVLVRPEGKLAKTFPDFARAPLRIRTLRDKEYIVASALVDRGEGNG